MEADIVDIDSIWWLLWARALDFPKSAYPFAVLNSPEFDYEIPEGLSTEEKLTDDDDLVEFLRDAEPCCYFIEIPPPSDLPDFTKEICPICLDGYSDAKLNPPAFIFCGHVFHAHCLVRLVQGNAPWNSSCPICRRNWLHYL